MSTSTSIQNVKPSEVKGFVATTVMLMFIFFWRAAAVVRAAELENANA
jgi:hypothetical protein